MRRFLTAAAGAAAGLLATLIHLPTVFGPSPALLRIGVVEHRLATVVAVFLGESAAWGTTPAWAAAAGTAPGGTAIAGHLIVARPSGRCTRGPAVAPLGPVGRTLLPGVVLGFDATVEFGLPLGGGNEEEGVHLGRLAGLHEAAKVTPHPIAHPFGKVAHRIANLPHVGAAGVGGLSLAHLVEFGDLFVDGGPDVEHLGRRRIPAQRPSGEECEKEEGHGGDRATLEPVADCGASPGASLVGSEGTADFTCGQGAHDGLPGAEGHDADPPKRWINASAKTGLEAACRPRSTPRRCRSFAVTPTPSRSPRGLGVRRRLAWELLAGHFLGIPRGGSWESVESRSRPTRPPAAVGSRPRGT